jgi:hypothetical protein
MLKTWSDTHYKLEAQDWLYIAKHEDRGAASLVCPGYARDGAGFSIHFTPAHIEILKHLLAALETCEPSAEAAIASETVEESNWVEVYPPGEAQGAPYKYPIPARKDRPVIR